MDGKPTKKTIQVLNKLTEVAGEMKTASPRKLVLGGETLLLKMSQVLVEVGAPQLTGAQMRVDKCLIQGILLGENDPKVALIVA